jgi:hypothetical protein
MLPYYTVSSTITLLAALEEFVALVSRILTVVGFALSALIVQVSGCGGGTLIPTIALFGNALTAQESVILLKSTTEVFNVTSLANAANDKVLETNPAIVYVPPEVIVVTAFPAKFVPDIDAHVFVPFTKLSFTCNALVQTVGPPANPVPEKVPPLFVSGVKLGAEIKFWLAVITIL